MDQRIFAIITSFDDQASEVLAAMNTTLPEAYVELSETVFEAIVAHLNYGKIEALYHSGRFWRDIQHFELGLYQENLDYNIFPLSKRVPEKTLVFLDLSCSGDVWKGEGFSVVQEKIRFRVDEKSREGCIALLRQIHPGFKEEWLDTWIKAAFETRGKAWWEQTADSFQP